MAGRETDKGEEEATFDQCYAYNIFPAGVGEEVTTLPKFTVYFTNAKIKTDVIDVVKSDYRFATVAKICRRRIYRWFRRHSI